MTDDITVTQKIEQASEHGSIYAALEYGWFTAYDVLHWVSSVPVTCQTLVAYKFVCCFIHPNEQYLPGGKHIITDHPEYVIVAAAYKINLDIPAVMDDGSSTETLFPRIIQFINDYNKPETKDIWLWSYLISSKANHISLSEKYIVDNAQICCIARLLTTTTLPYMLVNADWVEEFEYDCDLPKLVIARTQYLLERARDYYHCVIRQCYAVVVEVLVKYKLLYQCSKEELYLLDEWYPGLIDRKVLEYDNLCYKISLHNNLVAGYLLGFPIQTLIPSDDQVVQALSILQTEGIIRYCDKIRNYVATYQQTSLSFLPNTVTTIFPNNTDIMMVDDIDDHYPFDIVLYQTGNYRYRFTRTEFTKLSKIRKNPWTNELLPAPIIAELAARAAVSKKLGLEPCATVCDTLTAIADGIRY